MESTFAGRLADYRMVRRDIEANLLALAPSVDRRRFSFQAPLEPLELRVGGYVAIESTERRRLGQVLSLEVAHEDAGELGWSGEMSMSTRVRIRLARGQGALLDGPATPFHDAVVRPAEVDEVRAWLHATAPARAVLPAGELRLAPGLTHGLDAGGFDRHTFLCGQSGSGKTYALGVLLERLLLETSLRIGGARSELGLRPPHGAAGGREPRRRGALPRGRAGRGDPPRRKRAAPARAARRARDRGAGGGPAARPDP
jgi:DNA helicase HerA-like ATPase